MFWRNGRADTPIAGNADGATWEVSPLAVAEAAKPEDAPTAAQNLPQPNLANARFRGSLIPARQALADAIIAHRAAIAVLENVHTPLRRLQEPIDELTHVERRLSEIDRETEVAVGRWIADGAGGERPGGPAGVVGLRQKRDALLADVTAAQSAMPTAQAECQRAAQAALATAQQRDLALINAVVEVTRDLIEREMVEAVEAVLRVEAKVQGLRHALQGMADRGQNPIAAASGAAGMIAEAILDGRRRPGVPIAIDQARRFIDALSNNAQAVFE